MTELDKIRYFIAVWMTNYNKTMTEVCSIMETQLSIEDINTVASNMLNSSAYNNGIAAKNMGFLTNPYAFDTIDWWYWYAGNHQ